MCFHYWSLIDFESVSMKQLPVAHHWGNKEVEQLGLVYSEMAVIYKGLTCYCMWTPALLFYKGCFTCILRINLPVFDKTCHDLCFFLQSTWLRIYKWISWRPNISRASSCSRSSYWQRGIPCKNSSRFKRKLFCQRCRSGT